MISITKILTVIIGTIFIKNVYIILKYSQKKKVFGFWDIGLKKYSVYFTQNVLSKFDIYTIYIYVMHIA